MIAKTQLLTLLISDFRLVTPWSKPGDSSAC